MTGKGSATATLSGTKLAISGTFEGLAAPATIARLHRGVAKGARGPMIADLTITKATSGTITGAANLAPIDLVITADPSGGLLGQLLCALAGGGALQNLVNLLNQLLALFGPIA